MGWVVIFIVIRNRRILALLGQGCRPYVASLPCALNFRTFNLAIAEVSYFCNHHTFGKTFQNVAETLFLAINFKKLIILELGGTYNVDTNHNRNEESQEKNCHKESVRNILYLYQQ